MADETTLIDNTNTVDSQEPIYQSKDGQTVTHSQLLSSGYDEDRIKNGVSGGILTKVGDTQNPDQVFKTSDGQQVTTKDLLNSGYSQDRIDKGVHNGILTPFVEKKNQVGNDGATTSDNGLSNTPKDNAAVTDPTVTEPKQDDLVDLIFKANDLSTKTKSIDQIPDAAKAYTMGATNVGTVPDEEANKQGVLLKKQLSNQGIDADQFYDLLKDKNISPESKQNISNELATNPTKAYRDLSHEAWLQPLQSNVEKQMSDAHTLNDQNKLSELNSDATQINNLGEILSSTSGVTYEQKRQAEQQLVPLVRKYSSDPEQAQKYLSNESAIVYGQYLVNKGANNDAEAQAAGLTDKQTVALQYAKDNNLPQYQALKGVLTPLNPDDKNNTELMLGREEKLKRLDDIGNLLMINAAQENMKDAENNGDAEAFNKNKDAYNQVIEDSKNANANYPLSQFTDAKQFADEILGYQGSALNREVNVAGKAVVNTLEAPYDLAVNLLGSEADKQKRQMAVLGEGKFGNVLTNLPQSEQVEQTFKSYVSPKLQPQIDVIKNSDLSEDDKHNKVELLLRNNPTEWSRKAIDPTSNISLKSMGYAVSDLGATLLPYIGLSAATGGESAIAKFSSEFGSAAATMYHEELNNAIEQGKANPYASALTSTFINSAAMAGAGTAGEIRQLASGSKNVAIKSLLGKLTDDEIMSAVRKAPSEGLMQKAIDGAKYVGNKMLESAKTTAKIVPAIQAGQVLNKVIDNQPISVEQESKTMLLEGLKFFTFGTLTGLVGGAMKDPNEISKTALYEAGKNPEEYQKVLDDKFKQGLIPKEDYDQIKTNITKASEIYKNTPTVYANGKPMSDADARQLVFLQTQLKDVDETLKKNIPKELASKLGDKAADIQDKMDEVYKGVYTSKTQNAFGGTDTETTGNNALNLDNKDLPLQKKSDNNAELTKLLPDTLSPTEKQGSIAGGEENAAATAIVGKIQAANGQAENGGKKLLPSQIRQQEETTLTQYAKDNGLLLDNNFGEPHAYGAEQDVYLNPDGKTVTKVNNNPTHDTWNDFFHKIAIHNSLFPDVAYTLKGFTNRDGNFAAVLEQPLITKGGEPVKFSEVKDELGKLGFEPSTSKNVSADDMAAVTFTNRKTGVSVSDLHGQNVMRGTDGKIHFIDPIITLTKDRIENPSKYENIEGAAPKVDANALLEPHKDSPIFMGVESNEDKLKLIATQAQNLSMDGKPVTPENPDAYNQMVKNLGGNKELVDAAIEKYNAEQPKAGSVGVGGDVELTQEQKDAKGRVDNFVNGLAETNPELHKLAATDPIAALNKLIDHHKEMMKGADANTKAYSQKAIDKFEALKKDHELANSKAEPTEEANPTKTNVGENIPPTEKPPIVTEGLPPDEESTKMANAINDTFIKGKFGINALDDIIGKLQDTDLQKIYESVKEKIKNGIIDLKTTRDRILTTRTGSEQDQATLLYDLAELKGKERALQQEIIKEQSPKAKQDLQNQLIDVQQAMSDNALANRLVGRSASTVFRLRQIWVNKEMDIADMQDQYKASKGISDLTPEQIKEVKDSFNIISEARAKLEKAKEDLYEALKDNERLKQENEALQKLKNKATEQKKADRKIRSQESIDKSNARIEAAKEELRKLRGNLNAGFDPRAAIAIGKMAAEKVYQGVVKFDTLVKDILDDVKDIFPDWTEKDVANHILTTTDKDGNLIPSPISKRYNESKDLTNESDVNLKEKIAAYKAAQLDVAQKQFKWQLDRHQDILKKRPMAERVADKILRWQRFAILSYPSTLVKLAAVVAHQLMLKPLKFAIQKLVYEAANVPKKISGGYYKNPLDKATIWGDPQWTSISKYYGTFIRNFALSNLKEQVKGIDTKELLYGKPMMYDEWNAATGLLEIPGRTHGYIKSFIKNSEFQFAHNQQINFAISKMAEIQKELDKPDLTEAKRAELQAEYDKNDVTNEDVMERINKLSLEHGKWAILMNDNKFVEKFTGFENGLIRGAKGTKPSIGSTVTGAFIKSEIPIIKIPINYMSRAFATKYGLISALIGKGKDTMPSVLRLIYHGTQDLTEEQANLLGKTLTLGTIGASFFALGYMNRKNITVNKDGSIQFYGQHLSKNLVHSPEYESLFSGAETANRFEKQGKQPKDMTKWIESYVLSDADIAAKNPFANMLQYGFTGHIASALLSKKDDNRWQMIQKAITKKVADMAIPGFSKQAAGWIDTKTPGFHPMDNPIQRTPKGNWLEKFWETLELGIPGLRSNVPKGKK